MCIERWHVSKPAGDVPNIKVMMSKVFSSALFYLFAEWPTGVYIIVLMPCNKYINCLAFWDFHKL